MTWRILNVLLNEVNKQVYSQIEKKNNNNEEEKLDRKLLKIMNKNSLFI